MTRQRLTFTPSTLNLWIKNHQETGSFVAKEFGIGRSTVYNVLNNF